MEDQLKQATASLQYRDILILHLDSMTLLYREVLRDYAKTKLDEENFNECLTEMVIIIDHLLPKLEGSGGTAKELVSQFNEYFSWTENIMIPKVDIKERKKIHNLFKLILKAYDVLGLSHM